MAGGWALDLALGRLTRAHADVDVAIFREDQAALWAALPDWRFEFARGGTLKPWERGYWLAMPVHEVHARLPDTSTLSLEFLLNERDGSDWVYRRDPAVRLPLARSVMEVPDGLRVLAPAVVLLYKSKAPRAADHADFHAARSLLDPEERTWLRAALVRTAPDHPWVAALSPPPNQALQPTPSRSDGAV